MMTVEELDLLSLGITSVPKVYALVINTLKIPL